MHARILQPAWQSLSGLAKITMFTFGCYTTLSCWGVGDNRCSQAWTDAQPRETDRQADRQAHRQPGRQTEGFVSCCFCLQSASLAATLLFLYFITWINPLCAVYIYNSTTIQMMVVGDFKSRHFLEMDEKGLWPEHRWPSIRSLSVHVGSQNKLVVSVGARRHGKIKLRYGWCRS